MKHEVWTEKYRPKSLKGVIGVPEVLLKLIEEPKKLPHLLLYSKQPGTGKTSICKALIKDIGAEYLILNASDERKIEDIREKVKRFVQTASFDNKIKIVMLDECDGMIKGSQEALRNLMESYSAKFILTANNVEKIIPALQSRCERINLQFPNKEEIFKLLESICEKEKVQIMKDAVKKLIDIHYPSIRDMVTKLQMLSYNEVGAIGLPMINKENTCYKEIYELVKQGKVMDARKEWVEKGYNLRYLLKEMFNLVLKDEIKEKGKVIQIIADTDYRMAMTADEDITLFYGCLKMKMVLK